MFNKPELGDSNSFKIAITTTVEINLGIYEMVWTTFLNLACRTSFNKMANRIGIGKLIIRFPRDITRVFLKALQNALSFIKFSKYRKPTQLTPKGPIPGRYLRKASTFPNMGMYLKIIKYNTGKIIIA
jgi:hypothetical protein